MELVQAYIVIWINVNYVIKEQTNPPISVRWITTCWYAWKQNAAINDLVYICFKFKPCTRNNIHKYRIMLKLVCKVSWIISSRILTADCKTAGLTLTPSVSKVTGANRKNDMTVMIENRLMLSRDSWSRVGKRKRVRHTIKSNGTTQKVYTDIPIKNWNYQINYSLRSKSITHIWI